MKPSKARHARWAATLTVVVMFAIVVPASAGPSRAGMKQAKRYQSASSVSVLAPIPGVVGFEGSDFGTGFCCAKVGEVSFRVPSRARSVMVAIVDDTGLPVRAFVYGAAPYYGDYYPSPVCGPSPVKVSLARNARVLGVSPDAGLWSPPRGYATGGCSLPGESIPYSVRTSVSFPTSGTITVVFSRRG